MNIVIAGHVDHGKSTVIGRLLADTGSLPEGKLEQIREMCRRNSKEFEYAFLLDALKDERSQGITIDSARCFFQTKKRKYIIIDAPGHIEFLKNMITGAARAEAALLVIDAKEGVRENSRRHGYMLSMLGIRQIAVLVNKMDLVDYSQAVYERIVAEYTDFLRQINVTPMCFIPVSAAQGDNIAHPSEHMSWFKGRTVLEELDEFTTSEENEHLPFRMPVQDVYKFTREGDDRRIVAGTIESGSLRVGDEVIFYPSGKRTRVKTIEAFNRPVQSEAHTGQSTGFTVTEQIYVRRGELCVKAGEQACRVANRIRASVFWLGREPMEMNKTYLLKCGSAKVEARLESISGVLDASTLDKNIKNSIGRYDVADCVLRCEKPIAFDLSSEMANSSRFVLVDSYEISGGGIITEELAERVSGDRPLTLTQQYGWQGSALDTMTRAERNGHKAALVLLSGGEGRGALCEKLEKRLFGEGKQTYSLLLSEDENNAARLAQTANLLLHAGLLVCAALPGLLDADLERIKEAVEGSAIHTVWLGDPDTDIHPDLTLDDALSDDEKLEEIKTHLQKSGVLFRPF